MGSAHGPTGQQITFRDRFLDHGNAEQAYREAGYTGAITGMYRLLKAPWMDPHAAALARVESPALAAPRAAAPMTVVKATADALAARPELQDAVAAIMAKPVHPLETRRGRALWLIEVMQGNVQIEKEVSYLDAEGQRQTETETVAPDMKDRLKAAELLSKMSGDHVVKVDLKADVKADVTARKVYVHVDNGRGPKRAVAGTITSDTEVDACGGCGGVYARGTAHVCPSP